jgi:hypothetical protein
MKSKTIVTSDRAVKPDPMSPGKRWLIEKVLDGLRDHYDRQCDGYIRLEGAYRIWLDDAIEALDHFRDALVADDREAMAGERGKFEDVVLANADRSLHNPMFLLGDACTFHSGNWHQIVHRLAQLD